MMPKASIFLIVALSLLATIGTSHGSSAWADSQPQAQTQNGDGQAQPRDEQAGQHWRFRTSRGPVHVWAPPHYDPETAGIVVYVHGYRTTVDKAWHEHALAEQFRDSGRNALFIVPAAPSGPRRSRKWTRLHELVQTAVDTTGVARPRGQLVVVGHSGAYRTLVSWLSDPELSTIVLLDALYGVEDYFAEWLEADTSRRLIDVAIETERWSERLAGRIDDSVRLESVPALLQELPDEVYSAQLVSMSAQYEHMELVTGGTVIPLVLDLVDL